MRRKENLKPGDSLSAKFGLAKGWSVAALVLPIFFGMLISKSTVSAASDRTIHTFASPAGFGPTANLIEDAAGNLYGTTQSGGTYGSGAVFKLEPRQGAKWKETTIYSFASGTDGSIPAGGLVFDAAGNLYGTTFVGGEPDCQYGPGCGTVFKLSPGPGGTWTKITLHAFQNAPDGAHPLGNLVLDSAGNLYGVTEGGGAGEDQSGGGIVFELTPNPKGPWTEAVIYTFQLGSDGAVPLAGLVFDQEGDLYGTTSGVSSLGAGTVFKLSPGSNGTWTHSVLHSFAGQKASTQSNLIFDSAGNLYGTTVYGGEYGDGSVFELTPGAHGWGYETLYFFEGGDDGEYPMAGLVFDPAGNLYGTTVAGGTVSECSGGCGTVFELSLRSNGKWKEKVIYRFASIHGPINPVASLLLDHAGNLDGTTEYGASPREIGGTAFQLTPHTGGSWEESILYDFAKHQDGSQPVGAVVADSSGNLFGTTEAGGAGGCATYGIYNVGCGTVFKVARSGNGWKENVIYSFDGGYEGVRPESGLLVDPSGSLYGTAANGGLVCPHTNGCGTIFKLAPGAKGDWRETTLYRFMGGDDGENPGSALTSDSAGNLYGTTLFGGTGNCPQIGCGTVFELTPSGSSWVEKVLYSFAGESDGQSPSIPLIFDSAGNLYGATNTTVFKLTPGSGGHWTETVLAIPGDGVSGLIFDAVGNLYGTTMGGGKDCYCGAVFELTPGSDGTWTEKVLHDFSGPDGISPMGIVFGATGILYGTTEYGGPTHGEQYGDGNLYSLTPTGGGKWTQTVLHTFHGTDGMFPTAPPILDQKGDLLGTTMAGGLEEGGYNQGYGLIFDYLPPGPCAGCGK
jgi:uncharacterized repeat protein (TIGR03803 family)